MFIEFTTTINDYDFSDIPVKLLSSLKESMVDNMFFERISVYKFVKSGYILENQTYWNLI